MKQIEEEKTEELEFMPAKFKVIEHVRIKRACPSCKQGIYAPKLPPSIQPFERSRPEPGLLAQIIVSKYQNHLPLHRQEQMFLRHGFERPRQRMCDWLSKVSELLSPIYKEVIKKITGQDYFQADETTIKIQDGIIEGKLHTGYLWAMLGPPNLVAYRYAESRAREVPRELFKDNQATIQTDAYSVYNKVYLPGTCRRLACMAHIRRKFIEAQDSSKTACDEILRIIAKLYRVDNDCRKAEFSPEQRKKRRLKEAFPVLKKL